MKDIVLTREFPVLGWDVIQGSRDGNVVLQTKDGVVILSPKDNIPTFKAQNLSSIYNITTTKLGKVPGFFAKIYHPEQPKLNEFKSITGNGGPSLDIQIDNVKIKNISISDYGVSKDLKCCYLITTDNNCGFICTFENSILNLSHCINDIILDKAKADNDVSINIGNKGEHFVDNLTLRKLRITYMCWIKEKGYKTLSKPIWPLKTGGIFLTFNETSEIFVFRYNCISDSVELVNSFDLGLENTEYPLYCKQTEWIGDGDNTFFYLSIVTNSNKIIIKKVVFDGKITINIDETYEQVLNFDDYISQINLLNSGNTTYLTVVLTDSMKVFDVNSMKELTFTFKNCIMMENIVAYTRGKHLECIVCNSFGFMKYIKIDMSEFQCEIDLDLNYLDKIETLKDVPLCEKLNEIKTSLNKTVRIDSLNIDPSRELLYLVYKEFKTGSKFEFKNSLKDSLSLAIINVKSLPEEQTNFDVEEVNSILGSSGYCRNLKSLLLGFNNEESTTTDMDIDDIAFDNSKGVTKNLYLNEQLEKIRIANILNNHKLKEELKRKIQKIIGIYVIKLVEENSLQLTEREEFMYLQYKQLVEGVQSTKEFSMLVEGTHMLYQTFTINNGAEDIVSKEGHRWKVCDITLLPILTWNISRCENCESHINRQGEGLVSKIINETPICVFCGGRYK